MSSDEEEDSLAPLPNGAEGFGLDPEICAKIMQAKLENPKEFLSAFEKDEESIKEPSEEEIQNNPQLKILWAAENNHIDIVKEMLENDPELVNATDSDLYTPLHRASYENHREMAELLLSNGADLNAKTIDGWQPLHSASFWNAASVAELLLQNGADINAQTNGLQSPLHLAASQRVNEDILKLLLMNSKLDPSLENNMNETAYTICSRQTGLSYLFEIVSPSVNELKRKDEKT